MPPTKPSPEEEQALLSQSDTPRRSIHKATKVDPLPENGTRAWITLFGCFCSFFAALSLMNSAGAFQSWISTHQLAGQSTGKIGWIFGVHTFLAFFAGIKVGPWFDRYGPRPLAVSGTVLLGVCYIGMAECTEYWHFVLSISVVGGLATCLLFTSAIGTVQHWFMEKRGLATGIAISGGSVGGIILPLVLARLLPTVGFSWTARIVAATLLPFAATGSALMTGRFKSYTKLQILPDLSVLRVRRVLVLTLGICFVELGLFVPITFLASYALEQGHSPQTAYRLLTILNIGSLFGRWLPGYLGDRMGRFNAQIIAISVCLIAVLGLWLPAMGSKAALVAFALIFGLASGSTISLTPVCVAQLCKTEEYGRYYSSIYTVASFGSLVGVPIAGQLIQVAGGQYFGLVLFTGLAFAVALVSFLVTRCMSTGVVLWKHF